MINLRRNGVDFGESTMLIPAVAVGNVGQLAIDLLISSGGFHKVGYISTPCFIPIIGANPYSDDSPELCTSCDIYNNSEKKLVAIQIRSPAVKKLDTFFSTILKNFIVKYRIAKVIILTSGWSHIRNDAQIQHGPMRYIVSSDFPCESIENIDKSHVIELERNNTEASMKIPGGGFAVDFFHFLTLHRIPVAIMFRYCSEGDNVPDAVALMNYLSNWISHPSQAIDGKLPNSWKFLFGKPAPTDIY